MKYKHRKKVRGKNQIVIIFSRISLKKFKKPLWEKGKRTSNVKFTKHIIYLESVSIPTIQNLEHCHSSMCNFQLFFFFNLQFMGLWEKLKLKKTFGHQICISNRHNKSLHPIFTTYSLPSSIGLPTVAVSISR